MSELSVKIASLKGNRTTADIIEAAQVSRETFRKIERGESVKLSTLRQVADSVHVSESEWLELLVAWLKTEAGADVQKLWIETKQPDPHLRDAQSSLDAKMRLLFESLSHADQIAVIKAMERPEVRNCLHAINRVWEKFDPSAPVYS